VKPIAEQMITLGRRGDIHARRQAVAFLRSKAVVHKLFTEVAPRFAERPGGYSRIVKLGQRAGDAAEMAYLELVDGPLVFKTRLKDLPVDDEAETGIAEEVPAEAEADAEAAPEAEGDTAVEEEVAVEEESPGEAAAEAEDAGAENAQADEPTPGAEPEKHPT
jgi:large subunit ribosomal protein L17